MRRIVLAIAGTVSGLILVLSYPTSLNKTSAATATGSDGAGATQSDSSSDGSTSDGSTSAPVVETYTGDVVETRFGPMQVEITVTDGALTEAVATQYPSDDQKSVQINSYAIPALESATVTAQSASLDLISGATITTNAYAESLQSALDQAQL